MCVRIELEICKNWRNTKSNQNSQVKTCHSSTEVEKLAKHVAVFCSYINENTHVAWGAATSTKGGTGGGKGWYKEYKKWKNNLQARDNEQNGKKSIDMLKH